MDIALTSGKESYNEHEAAHALGITVERLHMLLDENIFTDGAEKPSRLYFRPADLVVLDFWKLSSADPKIMRMPRRTN